MSRSIPSSSQLFSNANLVAWFTIKLFQLYFFFFFHSFHLKSQSIYTEQSINYNRLACMGTPIVRCLTRLMRATINPGCGQLNDEDPDEFWPKFESCLITRVNYSIPFRPTEPFSSGNDHRHFVFVFEFKPEIWDYIYTFDKIFIYYLSS